MCSLGASFESLELAGKLSYTDLHAWRQQQQQ
jgi:hypothetical protein